MFDREWLAKFQKKCERDDRKWHMIELSAIVIGLGFFTLIGFLIASFYS